MSTWSMGPHRDIAQRGWYGDTTLLRGEHYRQDLPGHSYFMGDQTRAVAFGDRYGHGQVRPQEWEGAWVRWPDRATLLTGRAPPRTATAATPPAPAPQLARAVPTPPRPRPCPRAAPDRTRDAACTGLLCLPGKCSRCNTAQVTAR